MTAFGQEGPRGEQTAYDQLIQATPGMTAMTGTPDVNPIKTGAPVIDYATGTMCAFAISAALFQRERTGRGQYIDSSMLDVALMLMGSHITTYLRTGHEPKPRGNRMDLAAQSSPEERERLYESQTAELERIIVERTADDWEQYLQSRHVPAGRVRT